MIRACAGIRANLRTLQKNAQRAVNARIYSKCMYSSATKNNFINNHDVRRSTACAFLVLFSPNFNSILFVELSNCQYTPLCL